MKVIVFGATGGTGTQLVKQALENGDQVTAFARQTNKLNIQHEHLQTVQGDILDLAAVTHAIKGHDAVLCALGAPAMNKSGIRAQGTKNIIKAMEQTGVNRMICMSAYGCGDSYELLPFHYKFLILPLMLRHVYADHEVQEQHVQASKLDWTLVRPSALIDKKQSADYWHGTSASDTPLKLKISRENVAEFMLKQLTDTTYLNKAANLSA